VPTTIKTNLSALNERQRAAVMSEDKRLLVLAGAGSGKTKTLLQKLIYLIEEKGVSPSNILAITFTKNATNEMIDRLIISADATGEYEKAII
jgi:superfamily I DNA/RNA helicase